MLKGPLDKYFLEEESIQTIKIYRGKKFLQKSNFWDKFFSFLSLREEDFKVTGQVKCVVEVVPEKWRSQLMDLGLSENYLQKFGLKQYIQSSELTQIEKDILKKEKVFVYVYILKASFFLSFDFNSENDSYFIVKLGGNEQKNQKVFQNEKNPSYFEQFQFEHVFPGSSQLQISFFDEDVLMDNKIGKVEIDLERRYFDKKWRSLTDVMIEQQDIVRDEDGQIVGQLHMMVDILSEDDKKNFQTFKDQNVKEE